MRQIRRAANGNILGLHNSKLTKVLREFLFPSPQKAFQVGLVVKNLPAENCSVQTEYLALLHFCVQQASK